MGNTTAAVGKGFAIGSAALVSLALFGAFKDRANIAHVDVAEPWTFAGLLWCSHSIRLLSYDHAQRWRGCSRYGQRMHAAVPKHHGRHCKPRLREMHCYLYQRILEGDDCPRLASHLVPLVLRPDPW